MAIRKIRLDNDPLLKKKSRTVEVFDDKLCLLLDDMHETLKKEEGLGLAAVQVGVLKRVVVVDLGDGEEVLELINPEVISSDGQQMLSEGCLSLPGKVGVTLRPYSVKIKAQDRHGKWHEYEAEDLKARCFCHEIDHTNGILFSEKLAPGEQMRYIEDEED